MNSEQGLGEVVNFGSNFEVSIGETAELIADIMGVTIEIITDETRLRPVDSEVERLWADNTKAREILNWQPAYAGYEGFRRGLAETVEWFLDSDNLKNYKTDIYNI